MECVHLEMATTFRDVGQLGSLCASLVRKITAVSAGGMTIDFHGHNRFCPSFENFDAVSTGRLDSTFSTPGYWGERDSAFMLFSGGIPFGAEAEEHNAWFYYGGGRELQTALYEHYHMVSIPAGQLSLECGGWFKKKIETVKDFDGMKLRFFGLGGLVMETFGATCFGAGSAVGTPLQAYEAMLSGAIDGVEFLTPAIDLNFHFHEVANFLYMPGWHQPATILDLMINEKAWQALSDTQRAQIEICCGDTMREGIAESEALQFGALRTLDQLGVTIGRFPPAVLDALKTAWDGIALSECDKNPRFKIVWESYSGFRKDYARWKQMGHL